uniref:Predicted gene, 17581 n=1 Tax=Mus spicilegus TaxID=10103 RepID=A0A8C6GBS7_MUSSI
VTSFVSLFLPLLPSSARCA